MGFGVWGLGFGVWGLGFGVWGLGFGVGSDQRLELGVCGVQGVYEVSSGQRVCRVCHRFPLILNGGVPPPPPIEIRNVFLLLGGGGGFYRNAMF